MLRTCMDGWIERWKGAQAHRNPSLTCVSGIFSSISSHQPQFADENVPAILNALEVQDFQGGRLVLEGV